MPFCYSNEGGEQGAANFSSIRPPNTPLLDQLVPVMLFELGRNYFSIDTNLYVELDQEDLNKAIRRISEHNDLYRLC